MDRAAELGTQPRARRVSVIIPVRDNPEGVRSVLDSLSEQTLPRAQFEVIVGDDGSRPALAPQVATEDGWVRVVRIPARTSYAARNAATRVATGQILAFCDSDCLPEPSWLEEALAALGDADIVAGEVKFLKPAQPTVWSLLTVDLFLDQKRNVRLARGVTANLVIRREHFDLLGGFDDTLPSGGDYDFVNRAIKRGLRLRHAPQAAVGHPTMETPRAFLRKVWATNYWAGVRRGRRRSRPEVLGILSLVPILGVIIARRQALRPIYGLDRARLDACALRPGFGDRLAATAILYSVVSYVAGAGRIAGWLKGVRLESTDADPVIATAASETGPAKGCH